MSCIHDKKKQTDTLKLWLHILEKHFLVKKIVYSDLWGTQGKSSVVNCHFKLSSTELNYRKYLKQLSSGDVSHWEWFLTFVCCHMVPYGHLNNQLCRGILLHSGQSLRHCSCSPCLDCMREQLYPTLQHDCPRTDLSDQKTNPHTTVPASLRRRQLSCVWLIRLMARSNKVTFYGNSF